MLHGIQRLLESGQPFGLDEIQSGTRVNEDLDHGRTDGALEVN